MVKRQVSGATPLEDWSGIIPKHLSTREELNEVEFENVTEAMEKYLLGPLSEKKAPFTLDWLKRVHEEMFGKVWSWAGKYRSTAYDIGVNPAEIPIQMKQLLDDLNFWENKAGMDKLEISARLHHRLVQIHPFQNGNGRWARLITNIYLRKEGIPTIHWPEKNLKEQNNFRKTYIQALQKGDQGNIQALLELHRKNIK